MDNNQYANIQWIEAAIEEKIRKYEYFLGTIEAKRLKGDVPEILLFDEFSVAFMFQGYLMAYQELGCIDQGKSLFYLDELVKKVATLRKNISGQQEDVGE